jgi:hypothetical protein
MLLQELPLDLVPPGERRVRELAAGLLRLASRALDRQAQKLALVQARAAADRALLEFHADAGAPEGALYVDGQLVGKVLGVTRL